MDAGDAYTAARDRIVQLVRDADPASPVAATPGWDVSDLLRHVVGVTVDVVDGDLDRYAQPAWTAAQVVRRAAATVDDLIAEWEAYASPMADILRDPERHGRDPFFGRAPLVDLVVHQDDFAHAVDAPQCADPDVIDALSIGRRALLASGLQLLELPAIELVCSDGPSERVGDGAPAVSVTAPRQDLWRSLHGRRTREQVLAFDWSGDPSPYLDLWPGLAFSFPDEPVEWC